MRVVTLKQFVSKVPGVVALVGLILATSFVGSLLIAAVFPAQPVLAAERIERLFVDLDADGDLDLLVFGEVVRNTAPLSLPPAQTP
jgi:hypothetical protein